MPANNFKHGYCKHKAIKPEYRAWSAMKNRCNNPNNPVYSYYGGRGIIVCEKWANSFYDFLNDMGHRPTPLHSLDRFPNMDGNYEPGNCRWSTDKEQCKNRRSSRWYEYNGKRMIITDWAEILGVNMRKLCIMLGRGKSFEDTYKYYENKKL